MATILPGEDVQFQIQEQRRKILTVSFSGNAMDREALWVTQSLGL